MQTLRCKFLLFDLDGVLIDSSACIRRHWQRWANQHDQDIDRIMAVAQGRRTIDTMHLIAPHLDVAAEAASFTAREVQDTDGVHRMQGAAELLAGLPDHSWAIVTSGSQALAKARIIRAGLPVPDILVTADDVTHGKPDPEPYLLGAKRSGTRPEDCVVIEDAPAGVEAGKRAGMWVAGIASGHSSDDLLRSGADLVAPNLLHLSVRASGKDGELSVCIVRADDP